MDIAVAALEKGRRAGWAKAYALEAEVTQLKEELARQKIKAEDSHRLSTYASAVLQVIAPSLVPWLNGADPGVSTFGWGNGPAAKCEDGRDFAEYFIACESDGTEDLRHAGTRDAYSWQSLTDERRQIRDWRADQVLTWYHDRDATMPQCSCGCPSWNHEGPSGKCLQCDCERLLLR